MTNYDRAEFLEDLRHIRRSPNMWMRRGTFGETCALLYGMDLAADGRLLDGFQQWLCQKLDLKETLLPWQELSLRLTFPNTDLTVPGTSIPDETKARTELLEHVEAFLREITQ